MRYKIPLILLVIFVGTFLGYRYVWLTYWSSPELPAITQSDPKRTEIGEDTFKTFPFDILLPEGVSVEEKYSLEYPDKKQFTAVFLSNLSVGDEYDRYFKIFEDGHWAIVHTHVSEEVASLYVFKDEVTVNVTINRPSLPDQSSQVSLSITKP